MRYLYTLYKMAILAGFCGYLPKAIAHFSVKYSIRHPRDWAYEGCLRRWCRWLNTSARKWDSMTTLSKHCALSRKSPSKANSIQRCLTNCFQPMVRSAPSKRIKREDLILESMAFRITLGSDARKMSLWKRWDCRQIEDKIEGWNSKILIKS